MTEIEEVMEQVWATDWTKWDSPRLRYGMSPNDESTVPKAFEFLVNVQSEEDSKRAYHRMLNAIAHDHSGTVYPSAIPGVKFLVDLSPWLSPLALEASLEILTDLYNWVYDQTAVEADDGTVYDLTQVQRTIFELEPFLQSIAADCSHVAAKSALSVLENFEDE